MLRIRGVMLLSLTVLLSAGCVCAQGSAGHPANRFLVNPAHPFVYLRFDHIGPSGENAEPISRMWLWLVNNCEVPIVVRTFGAADDHLKDEIGVMDRVVSNPEPGMRFSGVDAEGKISEFPPRVEDQGEMPEGYESEVSSTESIPPGRAILFSVPVNHVSKKWHMEIPFEFDLPRGKGLRMPATGGLPNMKLEYGLWDLPPERQIEVERIIQKVQPQQ
jgi:hypothetical protein